MLRPFLLIVGVAIAAALLWNAGELHQQNCIRSGRTACSVLPWEKGKPKRVRSNRPSPRADPSYGNFNP